MAKLDPPQLRVGGLSGDVFVVTHGKVESDVLIASRKYAVTDQFAAAAKQLGWAPPATAKPQSKQGEPRLGYDLAKEAMRDGRRVRLTLSLHRGSEEGVVISVEDHYCVLDADLAAAGSTLRRFYWTELDGFKILPADESEEATQ